MKKTKASGHQHCYKKFEHMQVACVGMVRFFFNIFYDRICQYSIEYFTFFIFPSFYFFRFTLLSFSLFLLSLLFLSLSHTQTHTHTHTYADKLPDSLSLSLAISHFTDLLYISTSVWVLRTPNAG